MNAICSECKGTGEVGPGKSCPKCCNTHPSFPVRVAKCDCYAMFDQPHFHDCPAGIWANIPTQYKQNRWTFEFDQKNSSFIVTSGGYGICHTEDSEVAQAICSAFNIQFDKR